MDFFDEDGQPLQEQPIEDYALAHGLTVESSIDAFLLLTSACLDHHALDSRISEDSLLPLKFHHAGISLIEKPVISKSALELISQTHCRESISDVTEPFFANVHGRRRAKKLELPLLYTDVDFDYLQLRQRIREAKELRIDAALPPTEPLDESKDESLVFPNDAHIFCDELSTNLATERIAVSKISLDCFKQALQENWTNANTEALFDELAVYRSRRSRRLSPPLSPVSQPEEYFVPDSQDCQVPLSSDSSSLFDADLDAAEAALEEVVSPIPEPCLAPFSPLEDICLDETKFQKRRTLKLEEPLMSPGLVESSSSQFFDFGQSSAEFIDCPPASDSDSSPCSGLDVLSVDLLETLEEAMTIVDQTIAQETPESKGALARIPVPVMDFSLPEPDWAAHGPHPEKHFEMILKNGIGQTISVWLEHSTSWQQLQWFPFPSKLGRINLNETIDAPDVGNLCQFPEPSSVGTSADYVWKQPGLSILKRDDDDDEILEHDTTGPTCKLPPNSNSSTSSDLQTLARKRLQKVAIREDSDRTSSPAESHAASKPGPTHETAKRMLVEANDPSASSTLLYNFLGFANSKRRKLEESSFFSTKITKGTTTSSTNAEDGPNTVLSQAEIANKPSIVTSGHAPLPTLKTEGVPGTIITSITLSYRIITALERLMPHLKTVERDFNRWNVVDWGRNSVVRTPMISPLASEADIIVSPSTGIVIATLMNVIQRPLPGQAGKAAIREKIERVSSRYERLIVLVSQGNRRDESVRELVKSECEAYSEFSAFVVTLGTDHQVHYVGGGEETLSHWLAYFIAKYSPGAMNVDGLLIELETTWELILRRAGLNAFAAQVVLSVMKHRRVSEGDVFHHGLAGFIVMSSEERCAVFKKLLGGDKVLRSVGAVLDAPW